MEALSASREGAARRKDIRKRRAAILTQVDTLERMPNASETDSLRHLREEYNELVNLRAQLKRSLLSDPVVALPPELWPAIFQEVIDSLDSNHVETLLDLTTVSQMWLLALTSIPTLWTKIRLDDTEDFLAKTIACIHLSTMHEIELEVHLPLVLWRRVSSVITPVSRRIRSLSLQHIQHPGEIEVLADLAELSALKSLRLSSNRINKHDHNSYNALGINRMPCLKKIQGQHFSLKISAWDRFISHVSSKGRMVNSDWIQRQAKLPNLARLAILEPDGDTRREDLISVPDGSLASVASFTYSGPALHEKLRLFGDKLTEFELVGTGDGVGKRDPFAILEPLWRFPRLCTLKLGLQACEITQTTAPALRALNSVERILLRFQGDTADWSLYFDALITTLPRVEVLKICGAGNINSSFAYIESLENLRVLSMMRCSIDPSGRAVAPSFLRDLEWLGGDVEVFLTKFNAPAVGRLRVGLRDTTQVMDGNYIQLLEESFPCIENLVIDSRISISGSLHHHKLRKLILEPTKPTHESSGFTIWISDILVAILMRPGDTPALEKIFLKGDFLEWDILILLLERKNFIAKPKVSLIKSVIPWVELPYKLLHPISELLRGMFSERDSITHFSTEAIGQWLWNESITGCSTCIYAFRECAEPVRPIPEGLRHDKVLEDPIPESNEPLPAEVLVGEPPLTPEVAQWLSKQRERRVAFVRGEREARWRFHRLARCDNVRPSTTPVTGYSLSGARFEDDI